MAPEFDSGDRALSDAKSSADLRLLHASRQKRADFSYLFRRQLALELAAVEMRSVPTLVPVVFDRERPTQVVWRIVRFVAVKMRGLMARRWFWSMEGCTDKIVNGLVRLAAVVDRDKQIAGVPVQPRLQNAGLLPPRGSHATLAADFVSRIIGREPDLIYHGAHNSPFRVLLATG